MRFKYAGPIWGPTVTSHRQYTKQNLGLFVLPMPDASWYERHGTPLLDVVAVHGLNGDYLQTWTSVSPTTGRPTTWLHELLPWKLPRIRVMSFGYSADILANTSVAGVRENARMLLSLLRDKREDEGDSERRDIIFVAHSLGGIIIKQALRIANNERNMYGGIADCTKGIVFFGTPHRGANAAKWASLIVGIKSAAFGTRPKISFLNLLRPNSKDLMDLSEDFRSIATKYAIVSFIEEDRINGLGSVIVERYSAIMELAHEEACMIGGNHSSMCKFDREDRRFDAVWRCIRRISPMCQGSPTPEAT